MIWPEFLNEEGEVILDNTRGVARSGQAQMWILAPHMRAYHRRHLKVGTRGYFMEGRRRLGECTVIAISGLFENPDV